MPQITLEYSKNILEKDQIKEALKKIHDILSESLPTDINTCKSRAVLCDTFQVGDGDENRAFIHCTIKILCGRPKEIKQETANRVLEFLKMFFAHSLKKFRLQITIELTELSDFYFKVASE